MKIKEIPNFPTPKRKEGQINLTWGHVTIIITIALFIAGGLVMWMKSKGL